MVFTGTKCQRNQYLTPPACELIKTYFVFQFRELGVSWVLDVACSINQDKVKVIRRGCPAAGSPILKFSHFRDFFNCVTYTLSIGLF